MRGTMIDNTVSFSQIIDNKVWGVTDGEGAGIGTISQHDNTYTFKPVLYHSFSADSLLIISRYLNKLNKQGLDILR